MTPSEPAPLWAILGIVLVLAYGVSWLVARPLLGRRGEDLEGISPEPALSSRPLLQAGPLSLDPAGHRAFLEGRRLDLTPTEFKLLVHLVERQGQVQTRDELLCSVWGHVYSGYSRTVDTHVRRLREKLGEASGLVETIRGVGYRFRG